jgi:hypothetical protein
MKDYSWMKAKTPVAPVTREAIRNFDLTRADNCDREAKYWAEQGDETQAQRWRAEAERLRA